MSPSWIFRDEKWGYNFVEVFAANFCILTLDEKEKVITDSRVPAIVGE